MITVRLFALRFLGYEGVEVINPEGGKEDAEEEAHKGRWKQEVFLIYALTSLSLLALYLVFLFSSYKLINCEIPRWLERGTKHFLQGYESLSLVDKTLRRSPEGKAQRGQYLLAVDLGHYKWY